MYSTINVKYVLYVLYNYDKAAIFICRLILSYINSIKIYMSSKLLTFSWSCFRIKINYHDKNVC